ncbi:MAG: flavodoxin [Acidimicrobiales bacterium]|nr:flavodoxin [Acidimicrobiales bacterium]
MARLLIVHHTPSPSMHSMFRAVLDGATSDEIDDVEVETRAALQATASDALEADGYIVGAPANLGYMAGALKHFFDTIFYPCLEETQKRPFGVYLHGNNDTDGALAAIQKIANGLQWRQAQDAVTVIGEPEQADLDACWELGASVAAGLVM